MKTLFTLILSSSFLLTACGQDTKSNSSSGSPAPTIPVTEEANKAKTDEKDQAKKPALPVLEKVVDGDPSQFERTPKKFGDSATTPVAPKDEAKPASSQTKAAKKEDKTVLVTPKISEPKVESKTDSKKSSSQAKSQDAKSKYKGEGELPPPKPIPGKPIEKVAPPMASAPCKSCGTGNLKASQAEFAGLEVTGLSMNGRQNYITLVNDGLMTAVRREMTRGGFETVDANSKLAQTILNGRMFVDGTTGDRLVTLSVIENGRTQTYNFRVAAYTNRMKPMQLQNMGAFSRTTGSGALEASMACLDTCGKCDVAVLKLEKSGATAAKAYAILRTQNSDLKMKLNHVGTQNEDVLDIRSALQQVEMAKLETFEVAYGVSIVRTVMMARHGDMFSQVSPLVNSTQGALNQTMRLVDRRPMDLDLPEVENHTANMSAKVALASLTQIDGMGGVTITYVTKDRAGSRTGDSFDLKIKARPVAVYPMTGALLK